ncbi:efflux RND transporter periplasmic adaptor subunit [Chitinophaga sp. YR627]|uniref:efflux RND transporter periplasmic adaptor subunit n=1 Tax=Chitinophaga sp. YR627 TaxID=1881041 RepID=UPI0015A611B0|nr:efflux RND transporter periplasmic adaptor subunit [Chitinophaga sp. YR627]
MKAVPTDDINLPEIKKNVSVTTAKAQRKDFEYQISANGKVRSGKEQMIFAETDGKLLALYATMGEFVQSGKIIIQLDTLLPRHKVNRAELQVFNAGKEYESQLLGYENLLKDRTPVKTADIKKKLRIASGLAEGEESLFEAGYELSKATIRAPFKGLVTDIKVQEGQFVKAGTELFRIYDPTDLRLEIRVLESDVTLLHKGLTAIISPVSASDQHIAAYVQEINPYIDENGLALVKLGIKTGGILFPGMNCTALLNVPLHKSIVVAKEAVIQRSGRSIVFTVENGVARWNYVTVGRDNGKEVEILDGIKVSQEVIISDNLQLANETPVTVQNK